MPQLTACRTCESANLYTFLSLGAHPPANGFLTAEQLTSTQASYPLDCQVCRDCALTQVADQLPAGFFDDYVYVPSASATMLAHFDAFATQLGDLVTTKPDALVVDVGCNDGALLAACSRVGLSTLGIEPAANIAAIARNQGLEVINEYFSPALALQLRDQYGPAAAIVSTNTLNHIDDLGAFMDGVDILLGADGTFVVEVPQAVEFVDQNEFDTIYHEHLSTFSVTSLAALYRRVRMRISEVEVLSVHGGSVRVFAQRSEDGAADSPAVTAWTRREQEHGLFRQRTYDELAGRVRGIRTDLHALLEDLRGQGKRLAGYGAPAKGNTLLNYCQIGPDVLEFLADRNELKQGRYSPGMCIPVVGPDRILATMPDFLLILAWNFADEILAEQESYRQRGGRFIVPIPSPRIIE